MKTTVLCMLLLAPVCLRSQSENRREAVTFTERNLSGPRLGLTFVPGSSEIADALKEKGIDRMLSQFGWHFEHRLALKNGGPAFVTEWVPLIGGVEYGKFIPTLTLAFGIRLPDGFEFGLGPNLLFSDTKGITTALAIAAGRSFDFEGVSIPLNVAFVRSPSGNRITLIIGYAIER